MIEQITTRYFFNETCYRFHGAPPDYDYTFDLYSKVRCSCCSLNVGLECQLTDDASRWMTRTLSCVK